MTRDFVFQADTKVYFGKDHMNKLPEELKRFGKRVLLVYGGGSIKRNGIYDLVTGLIRENGMVCYELSGVEPNPRHTTVNRGVSICRENHIDVLLAIGGGSSIDCAKGIAATALSDSDNVWDLVEHKVPYDRALPVVTILTISATGSEMDGGAVISNMDLNVKSSIDSSCIRPKVSFLNPEFTYSVPKYQTACGSVDIMSHIFDVGYFNSQGHMDMLHRVEEEVLSTVIKFAPVALNEPDNYEARANLMWASSWALNGMLYDGMFQVPVCHAMEHELSAFYDITHGHGLAILTPRWLSYILDEETAPAIRRFGVRCMGCDPLLSDREGAEQTIKSLEKFFYGTLGLESHLSNLNIGEENFEAMASHACGDGALPSIKPLNKDDVVNIYRMCL